MSHLLTIALAVLLALPAALCAHDEQNVFASEYTFSSSLSERAGLGDDYKLFWSVDKDAETISFAVMVRTLGWVGFGLSPNGGMAHSDVVIGWVNGDGTPVLHDRYAETKAMPVIDESQDWTLIHGTEADGYTILEFTRKWVTCDDKDRNIEANTARVIFSWHTEDPDDESSVEYHGTERRGSVSLNFLGGLSNPPADHDDAQSFVVSVDNVTIPDTDTTYWCHAIALNDTFLQEPKYILKYAPLISKESIPYVHHIVVYNCPYVDENDVGSGIRCDGEVSSSIGQCRLGTVLAAWAVGGEEFVYPDGVAGRIGGPDGFKYIVIEMHYDNPNLLSGIVDNSGFEFTYTSVKPKYESSTLTVGHSVTPLMVIPPNTESYIVSGVCPSTCTEKFIPPDGVKIFASFLHTHVVGSGLELRHIRKKTADTCMVNEELPPIDRNLQYDFDYQQVAHLPQEITLLPGDELILKCHYTTTGKNSVTLGGEKTRDEMCLAFLLYYPSADFSFCLSYMDQNSLSSALPESVSEELSQLASKPGLNIKSGIENLLNTVDWNEKQVSRLQMTANEGTQTLFCADDLSFNDFVHLENQTLPEVDCPYVAPDVCTSAQPTACTCNSRNDVSAATCATTSVSFVALLLFLVTSLLQ